MFEKAKENSYAPACNFFDEMKEKSWDWFEFKENSSLINIPFKKDFKSLKSVERNSYIEFQNKKKISFSKFSAILKKLIDKSVKQSSSPSTSYEE